MRRRISISFASDHQRRLHGYNLVSRGVPRRIELQATYLQMGDHFPPIDHGLQVRARNSCRNSCPCLDDALRRPSPIVVLDVGGRSLHHRLMATERGTEIDCYRSCHRSQRWKARDDLAISHKKKYFLLTVKTSNFSASLNRVSDQMKKMHA